MEKLQTFKITQIGRDILLSLKVLGNGNLQSLQVLLEKCSDYFTFQDGKPVRDGAALKLLNAKPDGVDPNNKVLLGIYENPGHRLIGVFDVIKGYVDPETLSLGLMVLEPASRNKGLGHLAYQKLEEWAVNQKIVKIRLGVLFGNERGLSFWKSVRYIETGEVKPYLNNQFWVLEKYI